MEITNIRLLSGNRSKAHESCSPSNEELRIFFIDRFSSLSVLVLRPQNERNDFWIWSSKRWVRTIKKSQVVRVKRGRLRFRYGRFSPPFWYSKDWNRNVFFTGISPRSESISLSLTLGFRLTWVAPSVTIVTLDRLFLVSYIRSGQTTRLFSRMNKSPGEFETNINAHGAVMKIIRGRKQN